MKRMMAIFGLMMILPLSAFAEVTCESEYGECSMSGTFAECNCADGTSMGMDGASVGDGEEPAEPTEADCNALLAESCTQLPPDPEEECTAEELSFCNDLFAAAGTCFEDQGDPAAWELVSCCDGYAEEPDFMDELLSCMKETACDDWDGTCYESDSGDDIAVGEGDSSNSSDDGSFSSILTSALSGEEQDKANGGEESDESADDGSSDDSGCSATGSASILMLLGLAGVLRRKRG